MNGIKWRRRDGFRNFQCCQYFSPLRKVYLPPFPNSSRGEVEQACMYTCNSFYLSHIGHFFFKTEQSFNFYEINAILMKIFPFERYHVPLTQAMKTKQKKWEKMWFEGLFFKVILEEIAEENIVGKKIDKMARYFRQYIRHSARTQTCLSDPLLMIAPFLASSPDWQQVRFPRRRGVDKTGRPRRLAIVWACNATRFLRNLENSSKLLSCVINVGGRKEKSPGAQGWPWERDQSVSPKQDSTRNDYHSIRETGTCTDFTHNQISSENHFIKVTETTSRAKIVK